MLYSLDCGLHDNTVQPCSASGHLHIIEVVKWIRTLGTADHVAQVTYQYHRVSTVEPPPLPEQ